jgi:hypothetical protein
MVSTSVDNGVTWTQPTKMAIGSRGSRISSDKKDSNYYFAFTGSQLESPTHSANRDILKIMTTIDGVNWNEYITILRTAQAHYPVIEWNLNRLNIVYTGSRVIWADTIYLSYYDL